jgi:hypothetical protein
MVTRRQLLLGATAWCAPPAWAGAQVPGRTSPARLFAAWDTAEASCVGVLASRDTRDGPTRIERTLDVPTRAHGLTVEPTGGVLVVARRPGDWMLRVGLAPHDAVLARTWCWVEPQRAFNGHAIASPDGTLVYTTETALDDGQGLIGVRNAATLEKIAEWPTHGHDPHELLWDAGGRRPALLIANGGITTLPETGRVKQRLDRMDSSLVRLDAGTGALLQEWRADDARLSLRHLARHGETIAVALQAEHEDHVSRAAAPVLGLTDGDGFRVIDAPRALGGYGGDIAATADGFAVSCPRAGGVARYSVSGEWQGFTSLPDACALAGVTGALWVGGGDQVLRLASGTRGKEVATRAVGTTVRLDNHWVALPEGAPTRARGRRGRA